MGRPPPLPATPAPAAAPPAAPSSPSPNRPSNKTVGEALNYLQQKAEFHRSANNPRWQQKVGHRDLNRLARIPQLLQNAQAQGHARHGQVAMDAALGKILGDNKTSTGTRALLQAMGKKESDYVALRAKHGDIAPTDPAAYEQWLASKLAPAQRQLSEALANLGCDGSGALVLADRMNNSDAKTLYWQSVKNNGIAYGWSTSGPALAATAVTSILFTPLIGLAVGAWITAAGGIEHAPESLRAGGKVNAKLHADRFDGDTRTKYTLVAEPTSRKAAWRSEGLSEIAGRTGPRLVNSILNNGSRLGAQAAGASSALLGPLGTAWSLWGLAFNPLSNGWMQKLSRHLKKDNGFSTAPGFGITMNNKGEFEFKPDTLARNLVRLATPAWEGRLESTSRSFENLAAHYPNELRKARGHWMDKRSNCDVLEIVGGGTVASIIGSSLNFATSAGYTTAALGALVGIKGPMVAPVVNAAVSLTQTAASPTNVITRGAMQATAKNKHFRHEPPDPPWVSSKTVAKKLPDNHSGAKPKGNNTALHTPAHPCAVQPPKPILPPAAAKASLSQASNRPTRHSPGFAR